MIITLKVTLVRGLRCNKDWSANIELDESSTLEDLHDAIQDAVRFDNDHLYCFFIARTTRSRDRFYFDDENGLVFEKKISDLFPLPERRNLFYLFDWRDSWIFKVPRSRKRPHEPVKKIKSPRVEGESGVKPKQYPSFDEEDESENA